MSGKRRILIIEPHSDDGIISIGGFLEKYRSLYEYHFCLIVASDLAMHHLGPDTVVTRKQRLEEYDAYTRHFNGTLHKSIKNDLSLPLDADSLLDQFQRRELVALIELTIQDVRPDILMVQGPSFHHDHKAVYEATIAATRPTARFCPKEMYILENPTYVHTTSPQSKFTPNYYISLTDELLQKKLDCYRNCFPSQIRSSSNYLSEEGITSWARYRGMEARCKYAEALHTYLRID